MGFMGRMGHMAGWTGDFEDQLDAGCGRQMVVGIAKCEGKITEITHFTLKKFTGWQVLVAGWILAALSRDAATGRRSAAVEPRHGNGTERRSRNI
jgi:hypothetical protein